MSIKGTEKSEMGRGKLRKKEVVLSQKKRLGRGVEGSFPNMGKLRKSVFKGGGGEKIGGTCMSSWGLSVGVKENDYNMNNVKKKELLERGLRPLR